MLGFIVIDTVDGEESFNSVDMCRCSTASVRRSQRRSANGRASITTGPIFRLTWSRDIERARCNRVFTVSVSDRISAVSSILMPSTTRAMKTRRNASAVHRSRFRAAPFIAEGNAFIPLSGRTRRQGECSIALTAKRISTKFSMVLTLSVHATSGVHHVTSFGRVDTAIGGFGK
jgi:hypothetical protein